MKDFRSKLRYLKTILVHKWYVLEIGGAMRGCSLWRLLTHDLSKLRQDEFLPYWEHFLKGGKGPRSDRAFERAWKLHVNRNDHHWQHWLPLSGSRWQCAHYAPDEAICEMVVDWLAASRVYSGAVPTSRDDWRWYQEHHQEIRSHMHSASWAMVQFYLDMAFSEDPFNYPQEGE